MYLRALSAFGATNPYMEFGRKVWLPGSGADPVACEAAGGVVSWTAFSYDMNGTPSGIVYSCRMPAPSASAPSSPIVVTTNVQSQVSPQVSPTFVQQSNPSNSPVGSAPQSSPSASPQSPSNASYGASGADIAAILAEEQAAREAQAANDQAILDAINRSGAVPQSPQPQGTYSYSSDPAPLPSTPAVVTNNPPLTVGATNLQRAMPWIALAGFGVTVIAYLDSKRARKASARKRK